MCNLYTSADPILFESRTRSLRIHGAVTTIRLENLFWDILTEIAASENMTVNQLITKLSDEILHLRGELPNMSSFLRVSCIRYLNQARMTERDAATGRIYPFPLTENATSA